MYALNQMDTNGPINKILINAIQQANVLKILPKMLSEISLNFHLSVFYYTSGLYPAGVAKSPTIHQYITLIKMIEML